MTTDDFLSSLRAEWEACGPWVPDDSLTEEGLRVKAAFLALLADDRRGGRETGGAMTRDDFLTMPTGRGPDMLVAELVMGWHDIHPDDDGWVGMPPDCRWEQDVPHYTTDIFYAWEVHKAMCKRLFSERRRYLDSLTEVVRTRVKASVAWPDILAFIEPADFCRAALLAGVAEPAAVG